MKITIEDPAMFGSMFANQARVLYNTVAGLEYDIADTFAGRDERLRIEQTITALEQQMGGLKQLYDTYLTLKDELQFIAGPAAGMLAAVGGDDLID